MLFLTTDILCFQTQCASWDNDSHKGNQKSCPPPPGMLGVPMPAAPWHPPCTSSLLAPQTWGVWGGAGTRRQQLETSYLRLPAHILGYHPGRPRPAEESLEPLPSHWHGLSRCIVHAKSIEEVIPLCWKERLYKACFSSLSSSQTTS